MNGQQRPAKAQELTLWITCEQFFNKSSLTDVTVTSILAAKGMTRKSDKGFLIAIEGIDGAGKTTQMQLLCEKLTVLGFDPVCTKEPTQGRWGQLLRNSAQNGRLSPEQELNAFIE